MQFIAKYIPILTRADNPCGDIFWESKIYTDAEQQQFQAKLFVYDEYDGYLVQWKHFQTSPIFDTLEKAEHYVREYWFDDPLLGIWFFF